MNLFNNLPFTYHWILSKLLGDNKTVLDVGCGDGEVVAILNKNKSYDVTGIDLFEPFLRKAKKTGAYKKLLVGDIRDLKFNDKSFDVVLSSQVVEHLKKKESLGMIKEMERIAKKRVIIATIVGFLPFHPIDGDDEDNPLQVHKSGWEVEEFQKLGYTVLGQGSRLFYKEGGVIRFLPGFLYPIGFAMSYLLSPLNYFFPKKMAYLQIAVKNL